MAADLSSQLTNNCISNLDNALLSKPIPLEPIGIDKEDIFFAWLGKYDQQNTKMTICTLSFPSYHHLRHKIATFKQNRTEFMKEQQEAAKEGRFNPDHVKAEMSKEMMDLDKSGMDEHLASNDIIVSNWEFIQEDGDWKINGIAMRR